MILIRPAHASDAQALSELAKTTFIETFAKDNTQEDIDLYISETCSESKQLTEILDPERHIEIAWIDQTAAGFLHLREGIPDPAVKAPAPIELLRLYVDSRWHGAGVGAALMDRAIQIARQGGFQTLWLGVWENNFRAQAFYKKYGYTVVGEHVFKLGSDEQTDLIMIRAVSPSANSPKDLK